MTQTEPCPSASLSPSFLNMFIVDSNLPKYCYNYHLLTQLIDCVKVVRPTPHKIGHLGDVPQANLLAWYGKTKTNTTKARKSHV